MLLIKVDSDIFFIRSISKKLQNFIMRTMMRMMKMRIQTFSPLVAVPKSFTAVTFTVVKNFISTAPAPA